MISAIIPARNEEASIARAVESVATQSEIAEIIVVDDQSTDGTAAILSELAARIPKLKILHTRALPDGWVGKNYAVTLGADIAQGEWLLFTDADTCHMPGSARRALADAVEHDAVLVSYSPEQELGSFWERALIPFVYCRLAAKFSFGRVNDSRLPDAAANGQFLMVLRDVYRKVGGHATIATEVLEDVALARRIKQAGYRIYFTAPIGIIRTRMYRSFPALWQGWTKNLYPLTGGSPGRALAELFEVFPLGELVAFFLVWLAVRGSHRESLVLLAVLLVAAVLLRCARFAQALYGNLYPVSYIKYYVAGTCLYSAALIASWWKNIRGSVVWKGRTYPSHVQS
ncbi:MAG: glycosyltransferase [Candidatus Acidiferrales bacterium]